MPLPELSKTAMLRFIKKMKSCCVSNNNLKNESSGLETQIAARKEKLKELTSQDEVANQLKEKMNALALFI